MRRDCRFEYGDRPDFRQSIETFNLTLSFLFFPSAFLFASLTFTRIHFPSTPFPKTSIALHWIDDDVFSMRPIPLRPPKLSILLRFYSQVPSHFIPLFNLHPFTSLPFSIFKSYRALLLTDLNLRSLCPFIPLLLLAANLPLPFIFHCSLHTFLFCCFSSSSSSSHGS